MRFRFFTIPAFDPDAAQDALNAFCAQHRIVASDRHFVDRGVDSFWAVCVTWVEGAAAVFPAQGKRERVDYREVLGEADFAVYSELRRLRKQLAEREGVPAYAIFTNEQLAAMVQRRVASAQALGAIEGVGDVRVDKFGEVFLAALARLLPGRGCLPRWIMKRTPVNLEEIAARDNLVLATWKAARGKRTRPEVQAFLADLDGSLARLSAGIRAGTVPVGAYREFLIHDPKLRRIHAACFEDRVLHHAILNRVEAVFERTLADSSFACRPGRGSHAAVRWVQHCVRRYPWYGQVDVAAYFPSIRHDVLKALLARRFKGAGFLALLGRIIDAYAASPGCGLPIGALTSQHFANFYLDGADRRLLANPAVQACVRYMDDIVWWGDSRAAVRAVRDDLAAWLAAERGLALKPDARVQRSGLGITFCGYRILPGSLLLTRRKQRRYRALRAGWESTWASGQIDALRLQQGYAAVLASTLPADAAAWRREDLRRHPCLYDDDRG